MTPIFHPIDDATVARWRAGGPDANGQAPERRISDGTGVPCRHTLRLVPAGRPYLVLAHRPFAGLNPYTETGPIFVAADPLPGAAPGPGLPPVLTSARYLLRGYDADERIIYGSGQVVDTPLIPEACTQMLARPGTAFVHIRSATNGCFQVRVDLDLGAGGSG